MKNYLLWTVLILLTLVRTAVYFSSRPIYEDGQHLKVTTRIWEEPRRNDHSQSFKIDDLIIYLPKYPVVNYGDFVIIEGIVTGNQIKDPNLINHSASNNILFSLRNNVIDFFQKGLPTPDSVLVSGMVLGSREGMTKEFWESLVNTGTAHVVVASGMNVALVGGFVLSFATGLFERKKATWAAVGVVWVYAILAGFDAPIIRAGVMGSLVFFSQGLGRKAHTLRLLILTALTMLLVKPSWLVDLGFVLSFIATASLVLFGSKVDRLLSFVPKSLKIFKDGLSTSLAAQIGVAPILYFSFGQFNPLSPFVNAVILWTVPFITIIGMAAGIVGILFEPLGRLILFLTYPLTRWFIGVIEIIL